MLFAVLVLAGATVIPPAASEAFARGHAAIADKDIVAACSYWQQAVRVYAGYEDAKKALTKHCSVDNPAAAPDRIWKPANPAAWAFLATRSDFEVYVSETRAADARAAARSFVVPAPVLRVPVWRQSSVAADDNEYVVLYSPDGSVDIDGFNSRTGSIWSQRRSPLGQWDGWDSRGRWWTRNERDGFYMRSDGRFCVGQGVLRTCSGGSR